MIVIQQTPTRQIKLDPSFAGSYKSKYKIANSPLEFFAIDNVGFGLFNNSASPYPFVDIDVEGMPIVPYPGSKYVGPTLKYIPDDPNAYRGSNGNYIAPYEIIPFVTDFKVFQPPGGNKRIDTSQIIKSEMYDRVWDDGRIGKFLRVFSYKPQPQKTPQGNRNLGWMVDNWKYRNGGEEREGWFKGIAVRSGVGLNNGHYYAACWPLHNWFHNTNEPNQTYYRAVSYCIQLAFQGRVHNPADKNVGMSYYEKSNVYYGDAFNPAWEKQFGWNLFLPFMTGSESLRKLLSPFVEEYLEQLAAVNAATIYEGYWGIRKATFAGEDFLGAYKITHNDIFKDQLVTLLNDAYSHYDETLGFWPNLGSPTVVSPWMQFRMFGLMFRCIEQVRNLAAELNFDIRWIVNAFRRMYEMGMHEFEIKQFDGKMKICKYRINPDYIANCNVHRNASVYTPLKYAATHHPNMWAAEFKDFEEKLFYYAGSPLWKISPDYEAQFKPNFNNIYSDGVFDAWPIDDIGYDFGPEGLNFEIALSFYNMMAM